MAAAGDGLLNIYAQLSQEYDKIGVETEGQLQGDFAILAAKKSTSLKDLKKNMVEFERKAKEYKERCSKDIDESLKRSVMIAILDPETKLHFVKEKILGNYRKMRDELTNLFCHGLDGGAVPMDCDAVGTSYEPRCSPCTGNEDSTGLNAFGTVECWNCKKTGHPAR